MGKLFARHSSSSLWARVGIYSIVSTLFVIAATPAAMADVLPLPAITYGSTDPNAGIGSVTAPVLTSDGSGGYITPTGSIVSSPASGDQTLNISGNTDVVTNLVTGAGGVVKRIGTDFTNVLAGGVHDVVNDVSSTVRIAWKWASSAFVNTDTTTVSTTDPYGQLLWATPLHVGSNGEAEFSLGIPLTMMPGTGGIDIGLVYATQTRNSDGVIGLHQTFAWCTIHYPSSYRQGATLWLFQGAYSDCATYLGASDVLTSVNIYWAPTPGPGEGENFLFIGNSILQHQEGRWSCDTSGTCSQDPVLANAIAVPAQNNQNGSIPLIPPTASLNPTRRIATVQQCEESSGVITTQDLVGDQYFTETDSAYPALTPLTCTSGSPISVKWYIETLVGDSWSRALTPLQSVSYPAAWTSSTFLYTQCVIGSLAGSCTLTLVKISSSGQDPCITGSTVVDCSDWVSGISSTVAGSEYECQWGPYTLPVAGCRSLFGLYVPNYKTTVPVIASASGATTSGDAYSNISQCIPSGWSFSSTLHIATVSSCILIQSAITLFIPTSAQVSDFATQLKDDVKRTGVGVVVDGLNLFVGPVYTFTTVNLVGTDIPAVVPTPGALNTNPPESGCEGIALTIPIGSIVSQSNQENPAYSSIAPRPTFIPHFSTYVPSNPVVHPFSACYNPGKTIAYWAKFFMTGLIFISSIFMSFNIILGAFGLRLGWLDFSRKDDEGSDK